MSIFEGISTPILTPFKDNGEVDKNKMRVLTNYLLENGIQGLLCCGSLGEFSSLSTEEIKEVGEIVIDEVKGQVPVLIGAGACGTKEAIARVANASKIDADGVMVVPPFYLTVEQEGLRNYFGTIANSTNLPVFIYNIPSLTGQEISVGTISYLDEEYSNIVGIKDSSKDLGKLANIISETGEGFTVLQGIDTLLLPTLILGGDGGINGTTNIKPKLALEVYKYYREGNFEKASMIQKNKLGPLVEACSIGPFPENFKEASRQVSLDLGSARSPIRALTSEEKKRQKKALKELNISRVNDKRVSLETGD